MTRAVAGIRGDDPAGPATTAGLGFASLECELIDRRSFQSHAEARIALFTWIEGWYNPRRRHSGLGYLSPINHEGAMPP